MHCSKIQSLLSLNLDGRLPSARRDQLLDHLDACEACSTLADEMRAAQELVLRLEPARVGPSFRETLWERIEAGEGTPDAVFEAPVSLSTRLRYVATGAAAAAVFLLATQWLWPDHEPQRGDRADLDRRVASARDDADRAAERTAANRTPAHRTDASGSGQRGSPAWPGDDTLRDQVVTLSPTHIAERAQLSALQNIRALQARLPTLQARLERDDTSLTRLRDEIEPQLREIRAAIELFSMLTRENLVDLPSDLQAELWLADRSARLAERASAPQEFSVALQQFDELRPEHLERRFKIVCCGTPAEFRDMVWQHFVENPGAGNVMRFSISSSSNSLEASELVPAPAQPLDRLQVWIRPDAAAGGR